MSDDSIHNFSLLKKTKVLIVDDISENLQILGSLLFDEDMDISFAISGKQALESISFNKPDIVLLDISMPEMNGYQVCERIKANPITTDIPIIFLTANTDTESLVRGFKAGGQDYITKPFNSEELLARLNTHIELKHKKEELQIYTGQLLSLNSKLTQLNEQLNQQKLTIEQKNKDLTDSMNYARLIQNTLLPSVDKLQYFFPESFVYYRPKDIVSGDFYFYGVVDCKIVIVAGDCTGHGVPGALLTMLAISLLNQMVNNEKLGDPAQMLERIDSEITSMFSDSEKQIQTGDGMDIIIIAIDTGKQAMFSSCRRPLYLFRNNQLIEYKGSPFSIGGFYAGVEKKFKNTTVELENLDVIYMFSDGYVSQFGGTFNKKYNQFQFKELLGTINQLPMQHQYTIIKNTMNDWMGNNPQIDDILVMGLKYFEF